MTYLETEKFFLWKKCSLL